MTRLTLAEKSTVGRGPVERTRPADFVGAFLGADVVRLLEPGALGVPADIPSTAARGWMKCVRQSGRYIMLT